MEKNGWGARKFLIDGFPRNEDNVNGWDGLMHDITEVPFTVFFDADDDTMIERIMERSKRSGRNDDSLDVLKKRFQTFNE